jgi:predicted permease
VASLLLARAAVRRREIAVRLSLGAGRGRLVQQLLTESLLLGVIAGATGLVLSTWMLRAVVAAVAASLPEYWGTIALQTSPDARVFAYALAISVVTGIAFGLAPALQASSADLHGALKADAGTTAGSPSRRRLLDAFAFAQIAASLLLLVSSGLLLRSSAAALRADPGFDARRIIQLQTVDLPIDAAAAARTRAAVARLGEDLSRMPGIVAVAHAARTPLAGVKARIPFDDAGDVPFNRVTPNYFAALGVAIVRGRTFTREEAEGNARVAVISAATATRLFGGADPIGRRLVVSDRSVRPRYGNGPDVPSPGRLDVIGVAADIRSLDFKTIDDAFMYLPLPSRARVGATLVRSDRDAAALLPTIAAQIRRGDARVPVLAGVLADALASDPRFVVSRVGGVLAAIVALFGLVMASLGVYGMVGYGVAQRTREIGIRMALGAERRQVLGLVLAEGARPVLAGMAAGLAASAAAARWLSSLLFGVRAIDPVSFGVAAGVLAAIALVAIWLPARRAIRVDPLIALRHD